MEGIKIKEKGIVFFDIDGTLIDCVDGIMKPTEKTNKALITLKNNGYKMGLASGRPKSFIDESILSLPFDVLITSNGAYVEINGNTIYNKSISPSIIEDVISVCRDNNMSFILEGQDVSIYEEAINHEVLEFCEEFYVCKNRMISISNCENEIAANKIVIFIHNEKQYEIFNNKFGTKFKFMMHPNNISCDMYINNFSKASGIKKVIEKLKISIKDSYAFGDGINDIEMFQVVNKGISMGNADKELEKHAFKKTVTVKEEGIYVGLKMLSII